MEVVVAVGNVEAAGGLMGNTADSSKKMFVGDGVVVESGSGSKVVGSKTVQSR